MNIKNNFLLKPNSSRINSKRKASIYENSK